MNERDRQAADRAALERIVGRVLDIGDWPENALPCGTRVRVVKDASWDGPWREVFTGTVDATVVPFPVRHLTSPTGELQYSVEFDRPQLDAAGDGPYRKAVVWERCLEVVAETD